MKSLVLHSGHERPVTKVMFNFTGDLLFSCAKEGRICMWDVTDGALLYQYQPTVDGNPVKDKVVWSIDVTYDGSKLIAASAEGIFIFDVETRKQLFHIPFGSVARSVAWNKKPDDQTRFVTIREGLGLSVKAGVLVYAYDAVEDDYIVTHDFIDFTTRCFGVDWGQFDQSVISRHEDGTVIEWDLASGKKLFEKQLHDTTVTSMDFSPDRTLCLTCCSDGTAKLWTLPTWQEVQTYTTDRPLNDCAISPLYDKDEDTRLHIIVAGGQEARHVTTTKSQALKQEAILIHLVTAEILGLIAGHFSPINSIAFMPNGKGFATGAEEGTGRIYKFDANYFDPAKFS